MAPVDDAASLLQHISNTRLHQPFLDYLHTGKTMDYVVLEWVCDLREACLTWDALGERLSAKPPVIRQGAPRFKELPGAQPARHRSLELCSQLGVRRLPSVAPRSGSA